MIRTTKNSRSTNSVHLKCLFYYFKICGLAPVNLNVQIINNTKVTRCSLTRSCNGIVYNVFLIVCIVVYTSLTFYKNYFENGINFTFDRTVYIIVDVYSVVDTICIILLFSIRRTKVLILLNKLNFMRENMELNNDLDNRSDSLFSKIMTLLLINIPIWLVLIVTIFIYNYDSALMFSGLSFCIFVRNALTLQYCTSLKLIEYLLNVLNEHLSNLSYHLNRTQQVDIVNAIDEKLSRMWEWYSLLCKLTRHMSNFYSFPMLLNILCEFLMTITNIYYVMKPFVFGMSSLSFLDYVNSLCFLLTHLCPIILLTSSVAKVINEVRKLSLDIYLNFYSD